MTFPRPTYRKATQREISTQSSIDPTRWSLARVTGPPVCHEDGTGCCSGHLGNVVMLADFAVLVKSGVAELGCRTYGRSHMSASPRAVRVRVG